MDTARIDDIENSVQPAAVMKHLTDALSLTDLAINYYELEPGDSFAFAYHDHEIQEEVFYIQTGTATFDTEDGPVEVGPKELIRFGRNEFQRGWNRDEELVTALALGAPLDYGDMTKLRYCEHCEQQYHNDLESADDEPDTVVALCSNCGAETGRWHRGSMPGEVP